MGGADVTDHPCKGMTKAQREAFERIAIDEESFAGTRTLERLLDRGLVERGPDMLIPSALGNIRVAQYRVPLPVHAQWCEWCSEQEGPEND